GSPLPAPKHHGQASADGPGRYRQLKGPLPSLGCRASPHRLTDQRDTEGPQGDISQSRANGQWLPDSAAAGNEAFAGDNAPTVAEICVPVERLWETIAKDQLVPSGLDLVSFLTTEDDVVATEDMTDEALVKCGPLMWRQVAKVTRVATTPRSRCPPERLSPRWGPFETTSLVPGGSD
ncbi:unnamed protein product, partial [Ixodes pacificus]